MIDPKIVYLIFLGLSVISVIIMWRMRLFSLPDDRGVGLALMSPLIGFLLFLSTCAYVPGLVEKTMHYFDTHGMSSFSKVELATWGQVATIIISTILLVGFTWIHSPEVQTRIWSARPGLKAACLNFLLGILYCILTYPVVMIIVQAIHLGLENLGYKIDEQQTAVTQLKSLFSNPILFWTTAVLIVTLVPLIEELLFRGLLQNFFQAVMGPSLAIAFTSIFFAMFHYASQQAVANVELMAGLFLYSVFMGIFYIRTRSLWTTIGMHATFNALSICLMMYVA